MRYRALFNRRSLIVGFSLLYFLITVEALCKEVAIGFVKACFSRDLATCCQTVGSWYPGVLTNNCDILTMSRGSAICQPKWDDFFGAVTCDGFSRPLIVYTKDNYFDDCYQIDQSANDCDLPTLTRLCNVEPVWCCVNGESIQN